ncbi:uncharacterized protein LOC122067836 [Macadamia integrifolia]|uniref:uncharacterized protein LOC122067836 n=1 Tax=Macadamia integrifolia TaxID=60698 RepID=UPI001C5013DA|nr:uncharacterized protein LOC122067836 [Macadamia integrifolia]
MNKQDSSDVDFFKDFYPIEWGLVGFFGVGRGLRQGDPISPILFILAEEVLCRGLKNLIMEGKLKALPGPRGAATPSHRLFTFVFMNESAKYVKQLHEFSSKYQAFSSQKINLEKNFFEDFHGVTPGYDHYDLLDFIPCELDERDNDFLEAVPAIEEIKCAVWELDPDSSPGPDGFLRGLFRRCWEIVEWDFCRAILALRLSLFLPRLVSDEQGAFQKGKIISTNISLASELANLMFFAVRGGGMGIKLDVQKAYDSLSWDFLFATLSKFGFLAKWVQWIHQLLISSRMPVLANGEPVGYFGVGRGLRQWDPVSLLLFIVVEGVLCRGLKGLVADGKLKCLSGPRGITTPSHHLFANDIFIFMNASAEYVRNLHSFLSKYQEFLSQKINLDKSKVFFGKAAPHRKYIISDWLGINAPSRLEKYLGTKIFQGWVTKSHMLPLVDKIKDRLAGWK